MQIKKNISWDLINSAIYYKLHVALNYYCVVYFWPALLERHTLQTKSSSSSLFTNSSKLKLHRTVIRPIVTYASETWVLKETTIQKSLVFERKILRRIFGPMKENQTWRIKTNEELDKLIKHKNVVNYIKSQRLSWFGHGQRMPDTRTVKKIFKWNPLSKSSQERPKYRWEDIVIEESCQIKVKSWITCVQNQGKWTDVEKAINFNH